MGVVLTRACRAAAASTELVFVNFYADWCRFSNMLAPIWDAAADLAAEELPEGRVALGKVDCDQQGKAPRCRAAFVGVLVCTVLVYFHVAVR